MKFHLRHMREVGLTDNLNFARFSAAAKEALDDLSRDRLKIPSTILSNKAMRIEEERFVTGAVLKPYTLY